MLVEQADLQAALDGLKALLQPYKNTLFSAPTREHVVRMMDRLALCRPPVMDGIDPEGLPINERVTVQQCLHAGWAFWFGRERLQDGARDRAARQDLPNLQFLDVNRLCEQPLAGTGWIVRATSSRFTRRTWSTRGRWTGCVAGFYR